MTDQEKRELKNKLAKWVGWHEEKYEITRGAFASVLLAPNEELAEGHVGYIPEHTPNFPDSLDDCFKLLVPKVAPDLESFVSLLRLWVEVIKTGVEYKLALCLIIEKLIDGGEA